MKIARRLMALLLALTLLCGNVITPVLATETAAEPEVTVEEIPQTAAEEPAEETPAETPAETPDEGTTTNEAAATVLTASETEEGTTDEGTTEEEESTATTVQLYANMFTFSEDQSTGTYTVTVPAGETYNFELYNVDGMILSIDGEDKGIMSGTMMYAYTFTIANATEEGAEHIITLTHPLGSQMNPEALTDLGWYDVTLAEGDYDGYYYTFTAPGDGTATFYIGSITDGVVGDIILYNENTYVQKTLTADGVDNNGLEVTIDVNEGDLLNIQVVAQEDAEGNMYPAADISWVGSFAYVSGSKMNPIAPELTWNEDWTEATAEVTVAAGATTWYIINNGTYVVTVNGAEWDVEASMSAYGFSSTIFSITNDGTEDAVYAIAVGYPMGSQMNPEVLDGMYGGYAPVAANDFSGYNCVYTADTTGYITLSIGWITDGVEADIILNNQTTYENLTLSEDGMNGTVTMYVTAGDVVSIQFVTLPDSSYNYPAADIYWNGAFSEVAPGAKENPIAPVLTWNEDGTEATAEVTVPAGATYWFIINNGTYVVTVDGSEVDVETAMSAYGFSSTTFSITNPGEEAAVYSVNVTYPVGSYENPEVLDGMYGGYAYVAENSFSGYNCVYTADTTGYITLSIGWITDGVEADIILNNQTTYENLTLSEDGMNGTVTMYVTAGDVVSIQFVTLPDSSYNYPAADIYWNGAFSEVAPGAKENPIAPVLTWNEDGTEATAEVTVPAGATYWFIINNGTYVVTVDGSEVDVETAMSAYGFSSTTFSITNPGEEAAVYSVNVTYPVGSYENPEFLYYTRYIPFNLEEGDQDGYYYTYTAAEDGTVVLTGEEIEGVEYDVVITNLNSYAQNAMSENGDYTVSMPVVDGDVLRIQVVAIPSVDENNISTYPAVSGALYGSFIYPVGHRMNPEMLYYTRYIQTDLEEDNDQGYYYTYTAAETGTLVLQGAPIKGVVYDVVMLNNSTWEQSWMSESDDCDDCDDYTVCLDVTAGDEVIIQVVVAPDADWNIPAANVVLYGSFTYPVGHYNNPQQIIYLYETDGLDGEGIALEEGNSQGYFFEYYCCTDGVIWLCPSVAETGVEFDVALTNLNTSQQRTYLEDSIVVTEQYGEYTYSSTWLTMECHAGDTIKIQVAAMPYANENNVWTYPAANISLNGHYEVIDLVGAEKVAAGKSVTLSSLNVVNGKAHSTYWLGVYELVENENGYTQEVETKLASINQKGKLTVSKNAPDGTVLRVWAIAMDAPEGSDYIDITVTNTPVTKVEIAGATTQTLKIYTSEDGILSNTLTLGATTYPEAASDEVTWKSSNTKYATVDADGVVTALEAGIGKTVTITATAADGSGKKDTVKVKIVRAVDSIELPEAAGIAAGKSLNLAELLTVNPTKASNKKVTWTAVDENGNAMTISTAGVLKTKAADADKNVTVTATSVDGGKVAECEVTVYAPTTKVTIWLNSEENVTGTTYTYAMNSQGGNIVNLSAINELEDMAMQGVTWKSSNAKYATVDENGVVECLVPGKTVTITATATDGTNKKATVKIKTTQAIESLTLNAPAALAIGKSVNLAKLLDIGPTNATTKTVKWEIVAGAEYATLSSTGTLKAKAAGDVTVRVYSAANEAIEAFATVKVMAAVNKVNLYIGGTLMTGKTYTQVMSSGYTNTVTLSAVNTAKAEGDVCEQAWTWKSSNKKYATVENGVVTCNAAGAGKTVTITATATDGTNKKAVVKIKMVQPVESVVLNKVAAVAGGKSLNLAKLITINPSNATNKGLKWSVSENTAGIKISSSGKLTTKAVTEPVTVKVTVEAKDGYGYTNSFDVTVYPATKTVQILSDYEVVSGTTITLEVGKSLYLDSRNLDANGAKLSYQGVTWKSSKSKVVSVDPETGLIEVLKAGTAKITCTAADGSGKTATVTIKVVNAG